MNYKIINQAILSANDLPRTFTKDSEFYDYLLGNNVAYYYSGTLSKEKNFMDKRIIRSGEKLTDKYFQTLKIINKVCKENRIRFLLFKTYKYIPEVVDNDIDLLIKKKDFYRFMGLLNKEGFDCIENEPLKGICKKSGFCTIEPRVNSSFHNLVIMDEDQLWNKIESVNIKEIKVFKPIKEIDVVHQLLSLLYNPNYLRLYLLLVYKSSNMKKIDNFGLERHIKQDLKLIIEEVIKENSYEMRFPLFIGDIKFMLWWYKRMFLNPKLNSPAKLKHLLYFFYLKYSYLLFNKLVFIHKWPLR